jgi:hypothetical protein
MTLFQGTAVTIFTPSGDDFTNKNNIGEACRTHATNGKYVILFMKRE